MGFVRHIALRFYVPAKPRDMCRRLRLLPMPLTLAKALPLTRLTTPNTSQLERAHGL